MPGCTLDQPFATGRFCVRSSCSPNVASVKFGYISASRTVRTIVPWRRARDMNGSEIIAASRAPFASAPTMSGNGSALDLHVVQRQADALQARRSAQPLVVPLPVRVRRAELPQVVQRRPWPRSHTSLRMTIAW